MGSKSKREYLLAIRDRHRKASREAKSSILSEFCQVCGYNRKYAIRILNRRKKPPAPGRSTTAPLSLT